MLVLLMQTRERVKVQFDAQSGSRDTQGNRRERQTRVVTTSSVLPGPVGVEGVGQVGRGRSDVGHRGQADAEVRVGVHREPSPKVSQMLRQVVDLTQSSPVVVVRRITPTDRRLHRLGNVLETHDAHVGRERHRDLARTSAIPSRPGVGSSRYSRTPLSACPTLDRCRDSPGGVGIKSKGRVGKGVAQSQHRVDLAGGAKTPPFSLRERNPYVSSIQVACSTMPRARELRRRSGSSPGCAAHL